MPSQKNNALSFNQYVKSEKMPYVIYADLESVNKNDPSGCRSLLLHFWKKIPIKVKLKNNNNKKLEIVYVIAAHSLCNLIFNMPKEINKFFTMEEKRIIILS